MTNISGGERRTLRGDDAGDFDVAEVDGLSGCPSLTVKPNPDPLRTDPVATVIESCVGCGLCGEVAHAAVLCPSFYRAELVRNAHIGERFMYWLRRRVIDWLGGRAEMVS